MMGRPILGNRGLVVDQTQKLELGGLEDLKIWKQDCFAQVEIVCRFGSCNWNNGYWDLVISGNADAWISVWLLICRSKLWDWCWDCTGICWVGVSVSSHWEKRGELESYSWEMQATWSQWWSCAVIQLTYPHDVQVLWLNFFFVFIAPSHGWRLDQGWLCKESNGEDYC